MLAALSAAVMYVMADVSVRQTGSSGVGYHNGWMLFLVFAVYASARSFFTGREVSGRTAGVLSSLGGCVFGTYLLEGILRHYLGPLYEALEPRIHVLPSCIIWVIAVVLSGLAITWLLRRIPGVKRFL